MNLKILHITDFHISNINSSDEKLRLAFYEEFLDGLVNELRDSFSITSVDYLFCTGDFIDCGSVDNFEHAKVVIDYLGEKLSAKDKIAVCLGNHDYIISLDKQGKQSEARASYYEFEKNFQIGHECIKRDFYQIRKVNDHYVLIFDATLGSLGSNKPSILSDTQIDNVVMDIAKYVPSNKPLFVLSHYPMITNQRSQQRLEEIGWEDSHLWKSGSKIVERIFNKRQECLTFWFFGDGHAPDFTSFNNFHHFLMTGMIGGNYVNPTFKDKDGNLKSYNKHTEVKLVLINEEITINTIFYKPKGNTFDPHTGEWQSVKSKIRIEENISVKIKEDDKPPAVGPNDIKTELISDSVQREIIETIKLKKLYSFNRYSTSDEDVSLGWVAIPRLLESRELLNRCIDKSILWLKDEISVLNTKSSILIGLDTWGSIFATQISVRENIKNYCVATKDGGRHNVHFESIEALCDRIKEIKEMKYIIFFTDVVATGNTIIQLKKKLEVVTQGDVKWICVSLISDKSQKRVKNFDEFNSVGTLCSDLILPLVKKSQLPDESILPQNNTY